jgi:hypothetical protein
MSVPGRPLSPFGEAVSDAKASASGSVMVGTEGGGTLGCTPRTATDYPHVLICGASHDRSMQWRLAGADAALLAEALATAAQAALDAEARVSVEGEG